MLNLGNPSVPAALTIYPRSISSDAVRGMAIALVVFLNIALASCGPPSMTLARVPVRYPNGQIGYELRPVPISASTRSASSDETVRPTFVSARSDGCDSSTGRDECKDNSADRTAAENGDIGAQQRIAYYYKNYLNRQRETVTDSAESMRWYQKAAAQGDLYSKYQIGVLYKKGGYGNKFLKEQGEGVPQDYAEALRWLHMVADQPIKGTAYFNFRAAAQYEIGDTYEKGLGVPQSHAEAMKWFRLAASGNSQAQYIVQTEDAANVHAQADANAAAAKKAAEGEQAKLAAPIIAAGQREHQRLARAENVNDSASPHPDHDHALTQIDEALEGDGFAITGLQYDNGYADGQRYIVIAQWRRTFTISYQQAAEEVTKTESFAAAQDRMAHGVLKAGPGLGNLNAKYGDFKVGAWFEEKNSFAFIQTENGWMLSE